MISETFCIGNSSIHTMDPRLKVTAATVYSFVVALLEAFDPLILAVAFSIVLTVSAKLNLFAVSKRLILVNGFVALFWVILPLTYPGEAMFTVGPLEFSEPGILIAGRITLKSNAIMLAFMALVSTTSIATLGYAMGRMHFPDKLIQLFLLTYRYIFVIEQEYLRLAKAAKIRGFKAATNLHTYRTYAYFVGMLFVRAADRAEQVHKAMRCRGFKGKFYSLQAFSLSRMDILWTGIFSAVITVLGVMEWCPGVRLLS
jgi:cobalt/nickel transport system permease protein